MDYRYIEQLLERYWKCETSLQEEDILRAFFAQEEIPSQLIQYKSLFSYQKSEKQITLGKEFDEKLISLLDRPAVKAKPIKLRSRFIPFFRAAAIVAVILSTTSVINYSFNKDNLDTGYEGYKDTYDDPQVAYEKISSALMMVAEGINKSKSEASSDSLLDKVESAVIITE